MLSSVSVLQDCALGMRQAMLSPPSLMHLQQWWPWHLQPSCWTDQTGAEWMAHTSQHTWNI